MDLYFLRHGDAGTREGWAGEDRDRPLNEEGKERMRREGQAMAGMKLGISLVVSSPYVRAWQTAEIVAAALGLSDSLAKDERLGPGFDSHALREILGEHAEVGALLLVGHDPDFSETIGACIGGGRVECKKGGLAKVDLRDPLRPRGSLQWLLPPRVLAP